MDERLIETLRDAQRFGFFGRRPVEEAAEHSMAFIDAIGAVLPATRLVDLGSGGGLPGLVLAASYPSASVTLVDRREKRADFLRRAVSRLGFEHVNVLTSDVADLVDDVNSGEVAPFDIVTARGFGPPSVTLAFAADLVVETGRIVISEPPNDDRWDPEVLAAMGLGRTRAGAVSVFSRRSGQ